MRPGKLAVVVLACAGAWPVHTQSAEDLQSAEELDSPLVALTLGEAFRDGSPILVVRPRFTWVDQASQPDRHAVGQRAHATGLEDARVSRLPAHGRGDRHDSLRFPEHHPIHQLTRLHQRQSRVRGARPDHLLTLWPGLLSAGGRSAAIRHQPAVPGLRRAARDSSARRPPGRAPRQPALRRRLRLRARCRSCSMA